VAELVTVRFLHASPPYNGGEEAGFEAQAARHLVERGVAAYAVPFSSPSVVVDTVVAVQPDPTVVTISPPEAVPAPVPQPAGKSKRR